MTSIQFEKSASWIGFLLLVVYMVPYILLGEDCYITIHDNLDSSIPHIKNILDHDALFDENAVLPVMYGLPRSLFATPYDVKLLIFAVLPSYWAIVLNIFILKITAFYGMYLLLKSYVVKDAQNRIWISFCVSVIFAIVPFYSDYGISSAGIPLLIYAFLNLRCNKLKGISYLLIVYYAFYSQLVLSGLFIGLLLVVNGIYQWSHDKKLPLHYLCGIFLLGSIYLFTNWPLFVDFFGSSNFVSHRTEFFSTDTLFTLMDFMISLLEVSQYHAGAFWVLPVLISFLVVLCFNYRHLSKYFYWFLLVVGLTFVGQFIRWLFPHVLLFQQFQFDRFYFIFPTICFVLLAVTVETFFIYNKRWVSYILLLITMGSTFLLNQEIIYSVKRLCRCDVSASPSFKQYFDMNLFAAIEKSISDDDFVGHKIVCLGLHPSILEYNGFHTVDSYMTNYPLSYKHRFRKVIASELAQSETLKDYFDHWGSRCYLFSAELGNDFLWGKHKNGKVSNLAIDIEALKELDCKYIFSAVEIENYASLKLDYKGAYTTSDSFWNIRVYKIRS